MSLLFPAPAAVIIPTTDGNEFPVRRLYCIGRNYEEHAREMHAAPDPEAPFFFTKWADTVVLDGGVVHYPPGTTNLHHEVELVAAIGKGGRNIPREHALGHVWGYAVGLDMTRRDLQFEARDKKRPWDVGKNFDQSSPIGPLRAASTLNSTKNGTIELRVNGEIRQLGDIGDLINPVDRLIEYLSGLYELEAGDLIFTGTPAGVGPVVPGDVLVGTIEGLEPLTVTIGDLEQ